MTGKKILIVDDDQHLLLGLTARLKANGYEVICATDAISADSSGAQGGARPGHPRSRTAGR